MSSLQPSIRSSGQTSGQTSGHHGTDPSPETIAQLSTRRRSLRARLAHHAARAGKSGIAASLYLRQAQDAHKRHNYENACQLYSRALELWPDRASRPDGQVRNTARTRAPNQAMTGRALMHFRLDRFDHALGDLAEAHALAVQGADSVILAGILLDEARVLYAAGKFDPARQRVQQAQDTAPRPRPAALEARLSLAQGRSYLDYQGSRARTSLRGAADRASALGDRGHELYIDALLLLGSILPWQPATARSDTKDDLDAAQAVLDQCVRRCQIRDDRLQLSNALNRRSELWVRRKDAYRALNDAARAQKLGRELGRPGIEYKNAYCMAELYYYSGEAAAAEPHLRRAATLEPVVATDRSCSVLEARLALWQGQWDRARAARDAAETRAHAIGQGDRIALDMVELSVAEASLEPWRALERRAAGASTPLSRIEVLEMMALSMLRRGDEQTARDLFQQALTLCQAIAHVIECRVRAHLAMPKIKITE